MSSLNRPVPPPPQAVASEIEKVSVGLVRIAMERLQHEAKALEVVRDEIFKRFGSVLSMKGGGIDNSDSDVPSGSDLGKMLDGIANQMAFVRTSLYYAIDCCDL